MSWMQITQQLLELTGESKYADAMERLMINHVFAAQDCESGSLSISYSLNGKSLDGYFHGPIAAQQADTGLSQCHPPSHLCRKKEKSFISINTCPHNIRKGFRILKSPETIRIRKYAADHCFRESKKQKH